MNVFVVITTSYTYQCLSALMQGSVAPAALTLGSANGLKYKCASVTHYRSGFMLSEQSESSTLHTVVGVNPSVPVH